MRVGQIHHQGRTRVVEIRDDSMRLLRHDGGLRELVAAGTNPDTWEIEEILKTPARLVSPIAPGKIVAIGLNYSDHVRETGMEPPTSPLIFSKFPSSVIGPEEAIVFDKEITQRVDWEVELAVVVGRTMRNVSVNDALDYVFGYTVGNDISARDLQFGDGQWVRGKSLDTFSPLGPVIVTPDEIGDVQALQLETRVNGVIMQSSTTKEMIFDVASLLAFCSRHFTLEPGDVLLSGTPWGCGEFMDPRRSLADGDVVEVEIERIGVLRNPVKVRHGG